MLHIHPVIAAQTGAKDRFISCGFATLPPRLALTKQPQKPPSTAVAAPNVPIGQGSGKHGLKNYITHRK